MWEVSVPSWDEPAGGAGGDGGGASKAGGKKGRRKSGAGGAATSTTSSSSSSATGDVFKVVTASLQGEAVAQVQRAIEDAPSRRKKRKQSSQMELETPSPAATTQHQGNKSAPKASPRKSTSDGGDATAAATTTPKKRKRGSRGGAKKAQAAAAAAGEGADSKATGDGDGATPKTPTTPNKRPRGLRGGEANRAKRAKAQAKAAATGQVKAVNGSVQAEAAGEAKASAKPPKKKAKKDDKSQQQGDEVTNGKSPAKQQQQKGKEKTATPPAKKETPTAAAAPQAKSPKGKAAAATTPTKGAESQAKSPKGKAKAAASPKQVTAAVAATTTPAKSPKKGKAATPAKQDTAAAATTTPQAKSPKKGKGKAATPVKQDAAAATATPQAKSPKKGKGKAAEAKAATPVKDTAAAAATTPQAKSPNKKKQGKAAATPQAKEVTAASTPTADLDKLLMEHLGKTSTVVGGGPAHTPTTAASPKAATKGKGNEVLKRMLAEAEQRDKQLLEGEAAPAQASQKGAKRKAAPKSNNAEAAKRSKGDTPNKANKKRGDNSMDVEDGEEDDDEAEETTRSPGKKGSAAPLSKLQQKLQARLTGSRFRWINEQLYTTTGSEALRLVKKDPGVFEEYHKGFARQVELWPENPVDIFIEQLKAMPKTLKVADMGCGDAKIAQSVEQKVHSFDLASPNKWVTACDVSKVPLGPQSVDVVIFCLALMGTNLVDFINEAHRILKPKGSLKIAEVKSRFDSTDKFVSALYVLGFDLVSQDDHNKMFILFEFKKSDRPTAKKANLTLKPCIYKKR